MTEFLTISAITLLLILAWRNSVLSIRNYRLIKENGEVRTALRLGIAQKYNAKFVNWLIYERGL